MNVRFGPHAVSAGAFAAGSGAPGQIAPSAPSLTPSVCCAAIAPACGEGGFLSASNPLHQKRKTRIEKIVRKSVLIMHFTKLDQDLAAPAPTKGMELPAYAANMVGKTLTVRLADGSVVSERIIRVSAGCYDETALLTRAHRAKTDIVDGV